MVLSKLSINIHVGVFCIDMFYFVFQILGLRFLGHVLSVCLTFSFQIHTDIYLALLTEQSPFSQFQRWLDNIIRKECPFKEICVESYE